MVPNHKEIVADKLAKAVIEIATNDSLQGSINTKNLLIYKDSHSSLLL